MVRGGKVRSKRSFRKRVRSKERCSDDSDEDFVVSDEGRDVSNCSEDYCSFLDECASEESFDSFVEEEQEEIEELKNFNRSKPKNGICKEQKNRSKSSQKRSRTTYAELLEEEGDGDENDDEDEDEDLGYDDDEEFTPEKDELRGRKKKNNTTRMGKKVLQKRALTSARSRKKRRSSRTTRKPLRKKRRKNGYLRRKVSCDEDGDFIYSRPAIRTERKKKPGRKRRRLANSDCVFSGSSDYEYTISEEEREQVREAEKLCRNLRTNLRNSLLPTKNEEVGFYSDLHQQKKPRGQKGKEKIEKPEGRKGKEKVEDLESDVGKQVCGICLSEEDKRRVRGVLNCCTHYFCFACIMEWAKVESRCPLCKQRFKTISKRPRSTTYLREVVVQVPQRDQVYQPSEEELRSFTDPYEYVICSECHQGGDDGLMLLCDLCDSPAHTYCVGLGREVPEGNWYCDDCRPVALGSSCSLVQECVADSRATFQSLPGRPSPVSHVRESIDLNLMSSSFSQGFGNLSSRSSGRSVDGASPVSGGGAPTLSERRRIHHQVQQLLSNHRMNSSTSRTNGTSATGSTGDLSNSQIDPNRERATQHTRTQDVGTSYHTSFEERQGNNTSPLSQGGDPLSMRIGNARRPVIQDSTTITNRPVTLDGAFWPGLLATPPLSDYEQAHQLNSISNTVTEDIMFPAVREEGKCQSAKEQLQSMVKSHLKSLSKDIDIGHNTFKEIARSSTHTILAACGFEHRKSEVCTVPSPSVCPHIELMAGGRTSLIKGCCSSCFDSFVGDVVKRVMDTRMPQWLRLGL